MNHTVKPESMLNLTPHSVVVYLRSPEGGPVGTVTLLPLGIPAREGEDIVARHPVRWRPDGAWDGDAPAYDVGYADMHYLALGAVEHLPGPVPGLTYVVSRAVARCVPDRDDVVFPFPLVHDPEGQIIGCEGFACFIDRHLDAVDRAANEHAALAAMAARPAPGQPVTALLCAECEQECGHVSTATASPDVAPGLS